MKESTQNRRTGLMLLGLAGVIAAFGGTVLSQTLQGIYAGVWAVVMVLMVACLTYVGVRLAIKPSTRSSKAKNERNSSP